MSPNRANSDFEMISIKIISGLILCLACFPVLYESCTILLQAVDLNTCWQYFYRCIKNKCYKYQSYPKEHFELMGHGKDCEKWMECCPSCKPSNETKFKWNQ